MRLIISIGLAAILSMGSINAQDKRPSRKQRAEYNNAFGYMQETNNRAAIESLRKLHKEMPEDLNIIYNLGVCYINLNANPDSAIYFFNLLQKMDQDEFDEYNVDVMLGKCRAYQLKNDFNEALKELERIEAEPKFATLPDIDAFKDMIARERYICQNAMKLMETPVEYECEPLGNNINSNFDDYRPVVSPDGSMLIFTSRRPLKKEESRFQDGQHEEATYICHKQPDGQWGEPKRITTLFAKKDSKQQSVTAIANENTELYIYRDDKIYMSKLGENGEWGLAEKLEGPINGKWKVRYATVSADGGIMIFSSNRPGGFGGYDLWRSYRLPNGQWGEPRNLGSDINTPYNEESPVLHPTKPLLYFSSEGHNTMGGYDIFYAIQNNDSSFTAATNIGYPINTPDDNLYFVPTASPDTAYYATNKWKKSKNTSSTGFNICLAKHDEPEVESLAVLRGHVKHNYHVNIEITEKETGKLVGRYRTNRKDEFVAIVPSDGTYIVEVSCDDKKEVKEVNIEKSQSYFKSGNTIDLGYFDVCLSAQKLAMLGVLIENPNGTDGAPQLALKTVNFSNPNQQQETAFADGIDSLGYVVQVFALRRPLNEKHLKGINIEDITEHTYRNGWYVYSVGNHSSVKEALDHKYEILEKTPYKDSFVRNSKHYLKYTTTQNKK